MAAAPVIAPGGPEIGKTLAIEYRPIGGLLPYARNARTHTDAQIAQVAASMREFGWTNPILVDGANGVIAGHARLAAAKLLGLTQVPVIELAGMSEQQKRAYVIADNKLALNAGWADDLLRLELGELKELGTDLAIIGFEAGELRALFARNTGLTDPDEVPEPPVDPMSALGDVWILGVHRLVCGDSTDAGVVAACLDGAAPHLMVTDPPYGVSYDPAWRNDAAQAGYSSMRGAPGGRAVGKVSNDDRADWRDAWALFPGEVVYVWHAGTKARVVAESLEATGFVLRTQIVWAKSNFAISRGHYHVQHEPCWYAVRMGATGHWSGDRTQTSLWQIPKPSKSETGHSTQKPVECMKRPIENNSKAGDAVYDPFVGSGTTIIAAEMTGRCCSAIELDPGYVDVAVERWHAFTGKEARLATGETMVELAAVRKAT